MTDSKQNQQAQHYSLWRKILFPYSGEEPLTRSQGLRVVMSWILFFSPGTIIIALIITLAGGLPLYKVLLLVLLAFLVGAVLFGLSGWFVVNMNNRAARMLQAYRAARGGRYGS